MDLNKILNGLVLLLLVGRAGWWCYDQLEVHGAWHTAGQVSVLQPPPPLSQPHSLAVLEATGSESPPQPPSSAALALALARGNASVLAALLGDAAARSVQHRYLQGGFALRAEARADDGLALRDLAAVAWGVRPAHSASQGSIAAGVGGDEVDTGRSDIALGGGVAVGEGNTRAEEVGLSTNYGETLIMSLTTLLPNVSGPRSFDFLSFQHAWHDWQLGGQLQGRHRGQAAEIALKNLERGLTARDAATLVGDIGAAPRLPGLLAAFIAEACRARLQARRSGATTAGDAAALRDLENRLAQAAREISMATHDRPEALVAAEFLVRVGFRLAFRELLLPGTPEWVRHRVDRPTAPSKVWRAADAVQRQMNVPFLRRVLRDAEQLCRRQQQRAPLGGELGAAHRLDPEGDLADLGGHHTERLPTPNSDEKKRELFGLSGGVSAVLPAALYLCWKYERHVAAALTANTLLGGNVAGRGVVLGMLLGARAGDLGEASLPTAWLSQLRVLGEARQALGALSLSVVAGSEVPVLRYVPCPPRLCGAGEERSEVVTSADVRIAARGVAVGAELGTAERHVIVHLNISNTGASGLPVCLYGKLWLLWEAGGYARGRFRNIGDMTSVPDRCIGPLQWVTFDVNVSSSEYEVLLPGAQYIVGLLEVLRPMRGGEDPRRLPLLGPGLGNLVRAAVVHGGPEVDCEHFSAKVGRFRVPGPVPPPTLPPPPRSPWPNGMAEVEAAAVV
mmetsp:Transcript_40427/g.129833  ORF Transcript_40427/g.129833 Transcript_40427/m.129833 type:complete len:735 (+) Transcript_40427:40-2244(+)